uniref:Uncharacterized protein n=1 Tax=Zea mays TaxID=4577 RepID=A0A804PY59_MAIZE
MDDVMECFPLMVGAMCSLLFLVFPNTRYNIGCLATSRLGSGAIRISNALIAASFTEEFITNREYDAALVEAFFFSVSN